MSEIGKIEQLTTPPAGPFGLLRTQPWWRQPPTISLAEHDRTLKRVLDENARLRVERVKFVAALTEFRDSHWSAASADKLLNLLDALCGPKETPCL